MLDQHGREHGQRDGHTDGGMGRAVRPRPDLLLAVAFPGYRDSYLTAYAEAHRSARWQEERRRADTMSKSAGPSRSAAKPSGTDRAFDQGWRDGYGGNTVKPPRPQGQTEAYERGHKLGARDREYARAKELRRARAQDHSFER